MNAMRSYMSMFFFLRAAALNVQIRMEDGMDESKYKASFDGQLGAGTAGPGANFA